MSKQIQAIYERGMIRPLEPVTLAEGEELDVVLLPRHKQSQGNPAKALEEINGLPLEGEQDSSSGTELDAKLAAMREAMNDELFLRDLRETMEDFRYADTEETPA